MKGPFYNPCDDGFEAKAWECLRRNTFFKRNFVSSGSQINTRIDTDHLKKMQQGISVKIPISFWLTNPLHQTTRFYLLADNLNKFLITGSNSKINTYIPTLFLDQTWPKVDSRIRKDIELALKGRLASKIDYPLSDNTKLEIDRSGKKYLIDLPNFVWDNKHKKEILKQIADLLPKPKTQIKWRKKTGRLLGSTSEWAMYLIVEYWLNQKYSMFHAINLAAVEYYSKEKFGINCSERATVASKWLKGFSSKHSSYAKVDKAYRKILAAISSVYPVFEPMK